MKRIPALFGHIVKMNNRRKNKNCDVGCIEGKNRYGRQRKYWLDDIQEWCDKDLGFLRNAVRDRNKWKRRSVYKKRIMIMLYDIKSAHLEECRNIK